MRMTKLSTVIQSLQIQQMHKRASRTLAKCCLVEWSAVKLMGHKTGWKVCLKSAATVPHAYWGSERQNLTDVIHWDGMFFSQDTRITKKCHLIIKCIKTFLKLLVPPCCVMKRFCTWLLKTKAVSSSRWGILLNKAQRMKQLNLFRKWKAVFLVPTAVSTRKASASDSCLLLRSRTLFKPETPSKGFHKTIATCTVPVR